MKTITFNTKRAYTAAGQQITATLHDDNAVTFFDHGRHIDGLIDGLTADTFNAKTVLSAYDAGRYTGSKRSLEDGMMREGCNATAATEKAKGAGQ